jgi:preprotein translocase subunit SecE
VARPLPRKPAAVAERGAASGATNKPASPRRAPGGRAAAPAPRDLSARLPAPVGARVQGAETWARGIIAELRKVAWPTREEALKLTTVVIAISVVVGLFLGAVDAIFGALMHWFLQ